MKTHNRQYPTHQIVVRNFEYMMALMWYQRYPTSPRVSYYAYLAFESTNELIEALP